MIAKRSLWLAPSAILALALGPAQLDAASPSRIVDRTFACTPFAVYEGLRNLDVFTSPRGHNLVRGTVRAISVGQVGVGSGSNATGSDLVIVRARTQERPQQQPQAPGVYSHRRRCTATRATVPLSSRGLQGPPVRYEKAENCAVRGRVLVRVRAVLESPTSWLAASPLYVGARKNVVEATLAVRSERTRRPIAFLALDSGGNTRLWTSPGCG